MSKPDRTAFAALLADHRHRLGLTQAALATRTETLHAAGTAPRAVTERTIVALEGMSPVRPRVPHQATVRSLALALELTPGGPEHTAFLAAAQDPTAHRSAASPVEPDAEFISAGRELHLERLEAAVARAVSGRPAVALVTGEAGSGKSRLIAEACQRALGRHDAVAVLWSACLRGYGTMATHEPWRRILAQMLRDPVASEDDALAGNARRLDARLPLVVRSLPACAAPLLGRLLPPDTLRHLAAWDSLAAGVQDRLDAMLATPNRTPAAQEDVDAAIVCLLEACAATGPISLVLEDLHWADPATRASTRTVVAELARRQLPIAVIASVRTGDAADPLATRETEVLLADVAARWPDAIVDLDTAVGGDAGRAFVDAAVARLHKEPLAEHLFARTAGMPLFVMSLLRLHAVDESALEGRHVPAEIDTVFARQVGRLSEQARALLAAASVQGDDFLAEPALAAAGLPSDDTVTWLDAALAHEVHGIGPQLVGPGVTMHRYRFAHAMLRDHVAGTLSDLERSHLHLATADAFARLLGSPDHDALDVIATHLERGGEFRRAGETWIHAGNRAMLRSDHERAQVIFRHVRVLRLEQDAPELHAQAQVGIGNSLRALSQPEKARRALQQARREAIRHELQTIDANALMSLGMLDFDAGRMVAGAARLAQAIEAYTRAGDTAEAARANANLSFTLHAMGHYDEALARADAGIALATKAGSVAALASAEIAHANFWLELGYYERAIARYEAGLARNDAHGLTHLGNICLLNIALCHIELGRWVEAEEALSRIDRPERRLVDRMRSVVAFNSALLAEGRGDVDAARRGYGASRQIRQRLGQHPLLIDSLAGLLRVAVASGERETVRRTLDEIEGMLTAHGTIGIEHLGRLHLGLFEGHCATGDDARATACLSQAVTMLRERATRLIDPQHRASYLTIPPAHRRILELARGRGLTVPDIQPAGG